MVQMLRRIADKKAKHKCHKHSAVAMDGHRIIGVGWNEGYVHAEIAAIANALTKVDSVKGFSIMVIRLMRSGRIGMSRPCLKCIYYMSLVGIKKVYYTDSNGVVKCERI